jgi:hypothetical protein
MAGNPFANLVVQAFRDPRTSAQRIVAWPADSGTERLALVLVAVLATLSFYIVLGLAPGGGGLVMPGMSEPPAPFVMVLLQVLIMLAMAGAVTIGGRMGNGNRDFRSALRIVIWWQVLMMLMQAAQILAFVFFRPLAGLLSLAALGAGAWLAVGLVAGLHGFRSFVLTGLAMLAGIFVLSMVLALVLAPFIPMAP